MADVRSWLRRRFLTAGRDGRGQAELVDEALRRADDYVRAGADCVFPIVLWQPDSLAAFVAQAPVPGEHPAH